MKFYKVEYGLPIALGNGKKIQIPANRIITMKKSGIVVLGTINFPTHFTKSFLTTYTLDQLVEKKNLTPVSFKNIQANHLHRNLLKDFASEVKSKEIYNMVYKPIFNKFKK